MVMINIKVKLSLKDALSDPLPDGTQRRVGFVPKQ